MYVFSLVPPSGSLSGVPRMLGTVMLTAIEKQFKISGTEDLFNIDKTKKAIRKAYKSDPIAFKEMKKKHLAGWIYCTWRFWTW